ncbi:carbohydrate ABC transporter permease [Micromonospora profundi]|uniref:carbohydrate ABC transporter permease n=1 Tax=Micromonospora profundi TaxID=1420889 RepID=UPI00143BD61B|nr:carbohydrate ABC transporter permease [Micromonospora profundi]NJC16025.1 cellobiose transport system permease protein [Micromonospora profundi]
MSRLWRASPLTYLALVVAGGLSVFPIWWMFVVASRTNDAMGQLPPPITPGGNLGANISRLFDNTDAYFLTGLINSTVVATTVTVSVVFFSSLAGFAFAKLRFRGRNALLLVIIATMMVPTQLGVIPLYMLMSKLQWNDRLPAVIVPVLVTGFGVFMMRQYAGQAISDELIEAARMDGCGTARIWWHVVVPALRPAAAVLGLLTFMTTWNDFLWPYAVLNDPANPTVQLSLRALSDGYYQDMSQVFTGTAIATLPLLLVFVLFGRQIIGGIMEGAVKA